MTSRQVRDAFTTLAAALACVLLVLGLHDTPQRTLEIVATSLPATTAPRDAALLVKVTRAGAAVANASVRIYVEHDGNEYPAGAGATNGAGEATLDELPREAVWVLVEAAGLTRVARAVALVHGRTSLDVALEPEHTLGVHVTDERGAAISGATVLVTASDALPFGALTDAKGDATVTHLPAEPWDLKASARGYESSERSAVTGRTTLALRRLGSISVLVTHPDGSHAAQATVAIAGSSLWPARRTVTDGDGRCRIAGLLGGAYDLVATLEREVSEPLVGYALERGSEADVTLVLAPGRFVTALVTDGDGANPTLVADADVVLAPGGVGSFPLLGRTAPNGRVTLGPISRGPATLGARADGFVSSALVAVPKDVTEPVTVALLRGATLRGDVVDDRGFPIAGATIDVVGTDAFGLP
ncbi:MAG TPA: carboxypeptidase-like regulatory domain-containing protein, partial [Polyangiaceae bacterium]|nr:carboxypeptidase-like regulatory domain-containing protein [Polyangiaceae bacterium]